MADTGLSSLRDDDKVPVVRDLPLPCTLGVAGKIAMHLEELTDAVARDQQCLGGLGQASPAWAPDSARLIA